jgi:hypothetical protein
LSSLVLFASGLAGHARASVHALSGGFAAIVATVQRDLDGMLRAPRSLAAIGWLVAWIRLIHSASS